MNTPAFRPLVVAFSLVVSQPTVASEPGHPNRDFASQLRRKVVLRGVEDRRFTVEQRMRHYNVPALSVAVIENCEVVDARAFGSATPAGTPATPRTLFQAGSVSKVVATAGALKLVEAGTLTLDKDIDQYLTGGSLSRTDAFASTPITLRHLLTHSAGLSVAGFKGYPIGSPLPTLQQILDGQAPANTDPVRVEAVPGTTWRYSGGGFVLAQQLMERTSREPFARLLQRTVLAPADMQRSTFAQPIDAGLAPDAAAGTLADGTPIPGNWRVYPEHAAAGLWSTPTDLAKFAIDLVHSLRGKPDALLGQVTAKEMMRRQIGDWGLGVEVSPLGAPRKFSHGGAPIGYRTLWLMYPDTCQGAVIMANADEGMTLIQEVARSIADTRGWPEQMPSNTEDVIPMSPDIAERFVGTYRLKDHPAEQFHIERQRDGRVTWRRDGHGARELLAATRRRLFSPDSGMVLEVEDAAIGEAPSQAQVLRLVFSGGVNLAERKEPLK